MSFFVLLKKEAMELGRNKVYLSFLAFCLVLVAILLVRQVKLPETVYYMFIPILVSQYVFDSCYNDIRHGGALFCINLKCSTLQIMLSKAVYAISIGAVLFLGFVLVFGFKVKNLIWFIPFLVGLTFFTYTVTLLSKKSDLITSAISGFVSLGILQLIFNTNNQFCQVGFSLLFVVAAFLLAHIFSKTIFFRSEIVGS